MPWYFIFSVWDDGLFCLNLGGNLSLPPPTPCILYLWPIPDYKIPTFPSKYTNMIYSCLTEHGTSTIQMYLTALDLNIRHVLYPQPPPGLHNTIISGAFLRTKSNVLFGTPTLQGTYYSPTTGGTYKPKSVPYTYDRTKFRKANAIPLKYYSKWCTQCADSVIRITRSKNKTNSKI